METSIIDSFFGLFEFASRAYGTGNLFFDALALIGISFLSGLTVFIMQVTGITRRSGERDVALLENVAELLNELNLQVSETHSSMVNEFHRCRGELGAIRQDMVDLKSAINNRTIGHKGSLSSATGSNTGPTFYGGRKSNGTNLRGGVTS